MLVKLVILLDFTKHKLCPKKNTSPFKNQTNVTLMDFMDMLSAPKAMTMVLDLDETLIHHTLTPPTIGKYKTLQFKPVGADSWITFYVQKRPFLSEFIELLQKDFKIIIYTSSLKEYADVIIDYIDAHKVLNKRYYRDSCVQSNGQFFKDLKQVDSDLNKTFILDNDPHKILQEKNVVKIKSWEGENNHDSCLAALATIIRQKCEEMKESENWNKRLDITSFVKD